MIVLHDNAGGVDLSHIQAIGSIEEGFHLFDYVSIEQQDGSKWIGQIIQPNQNISIVGGRLDPTILHGLKLMQDHKDIQSVESVQVFDILILGALEDSFLLTPRLRPLPCSMVNKLSVELTRKVIEIPAMESHLDDGTNAIGELMNADGVPLCVTPHLFNYHFMVAGGTGSGKSNASANLVTQAINYDKCVLIHDAKPDYALVKNKNSDKNVSHIWKRLEKHQLKPKAPTDVLKIGFFRMCSHDKVDNVVGFSASDFAPDMLASLFFSSGEELQFEGFASSANSLMNEVISKTRESYSLDDIITTVQSRMKSKDETIAINEASGKAIVRKVTTRKNSMPWLDVVGQQLSDGNGGQKLQSSLTGNVHKKVEKFDIELFAKKGRLIVIDYSKMDEQSYALILSYFLKTCQEYRKNRKEAGIVQLVDEAHRIFDNESKHSGALTRAFEKAMREGRSVDHSLIVSLQNASQIPPRVMNNLNSKIVMRQNSKHEADVATQTMGKDYAVQAMRLGTGHALVSLFESRAVVLAQMAPSPFDLMRNDNTSNESV